MPEASLQWIRADEKFRISEAQLAGPVTREWTYLRVKV